MCMGGWKRRHIVAGIGLVSVVFTIPTLLGIGVYIGGKASMDGAKRVSAKLRKYMEKSQMVCIPFSEAHHNSLLALRPKKSKPG